MVKLIVLGEQVRKFSEERNRIAHQVPFWFNEETSEIGFFNDKNTTIPQISIRPPYVANIKSLTKLAQQMNLVAIWLSALEPKCLPEGVTLPSNISAEEIGVFLRKHLTHHPMWDDDARFPWPDIFNRKKKEEARKPQNVHRVLQGASCSESV